MRAGARAESVGAICVHAAAVIALVRMVVAAGKIGLSCAGTADGLCGGLRQALSVVGGGGVRVQVPGCGLRREAARRLAGHPHSVDARLVARFGGRAAEAKAFRLLARRDEAFLTRRQGRARAERDGEAKQDFKHGESPTIHDFTMADRPPPRPSPPPPPSRPPPRHRRCDRRRRRHRERHHRSRHRLSRRPHPRHCSPAVRTKLEPTCGARLGVLGAVVASSAATRSADQGKARDLLLRARGSAAGGGCAPGSSWSYRHNSPLRTRAVTIIGGIELVRRAPIGRSPNQCRSRRRPRVRGRRPNSSQPASS